MRGERGMRGREVVRMGVGGGGGLGLAAEWVWERAAFGDG